eukprot:406476-Prorocentrum_minimum.AAC.1
MEEMPYGAPTLNYLSKSKDVTWYTGTVIHLTHQAFLKTKFPEDTLSAHNLGGTHRLERVGCLLLGHELYESEPAVRPIELAGDAQTLDLKPIRETNERNQ